GPSRPGRKVISVAPVLFTGDLDAMDGREPPGACVQRARDRFAGGGDADRRRERPEWPLRDHGIDLRRKREDTHVRVAPDELEQLAPETGRLPTGPRPL